MRSESLDNTLVGQAQKDTIALDKALVGIAQKQPIPDFVTKDSTSPVPMHQEKVEEKKVEMLVEEEKMQQKEESMEQKEEKLKQNEQEDSRAKSKDDNNEANTNSQNKNGAVTDIRSSKSADHVVLGEEGSGGVRIRRRMVNKFGSFRRKSQNETSDSHEAPSDDSDAPAPSAPLRRITSFRRMRPRSNISLQGDSASEDSDAPSAQPTISRRFGSLKKMGSFKRKGHARNGSAPVDIRSSPSSASDNTTDASEATTYRGPSLFAQRNDDLAYDFATSKDEEKTTEKKKPEEPIQTGLVRTFNGFGGASGGRQNDTLFMMSSKKKTEPAKPDEQVMKPTEENEVGPDETEIKKEIENDYDEIENETKVESSKIENESVAPAAL